LEKSEDFKIRFFFCFEKIWYDIRTFAQHKGSETGLINVDMESIPVYQRGGTIVPQRLRKRRASMLALHDPITLVVALDRNVSD
jgi:alpha 1,3-glucosidase